MILACVHAHTMGSACKVDQHADYLYCAIKGVNVMQSKHTVASYTSNVPYSCLC